VVADEGIGLDEGEIPMDEMPFDFLDICPRS
jgi:hypothetical protein